MSGSVHDLKNMQIYTAETWNYIKENGIRADPTKDALERDTIEIFKGDAEMISQRQECEMFEILCRSMNAKNCIEIGVFTGSSSISILRGMAPDGKLIALDVSKEFTDIARKYWEVENLSNKVELILGPAGEYLQKLIDEGKEGTFDFVYVDANKDGYVDYFEKCVRLLRRGGVIAFDNVIWSNRISDPSANDLSTTSLRALNARVFADPRVKNVILPMADGVNLVVKL